MTKRTTKKPKVKFRHKGSFCECVARWLFKQKLTLLSFYHASNIQQEKIYFDFLLKREQGIICYDSPEANAIREFVRERGKHYARKGVNETVAIEQAPIIKITLPRAQAYKTLPNKKK